MIFEFVLDHRSVRRSKEETAWHDSDSYVLKEEVRTPVSASFHTVYHGKTRFPKLPRHVFEGEVEDDKIRAKSKLSNDAISWPKKHIFVSFFKAKVGSNDVSFHSHSVEGYLNRS